MPPPPRHRRTPFHGAAAAVLLACCAATPAAAFVVNGAVVDLAPGAEGGDLNLANQTAFLDQARAAADPTAGLVDIMARLPTAENRRAAFAWILATSARPAIEGPAALYALVRAGVTEPRPVMQAAVYAVLRGARSQDLHAWAAAAGLGEPALGQLARLAGVERPEWRVTRATASVPAAAGGG